MEKKDENCCECLLRKACSHVLNFLVGSKNRQLSWFVLLAYLAFFRRTSLKYEKEKTFHSRNFTKNGKNLSFYGIILSTSHVLMHLIKKSFRYSVYYFSSYSKAKWISQAPTTLPGNLSIVEQIHFSYCNRSCPWKDNNFPRNSCGRLELVVVSKKDFLNNYLARFPITANQQRLHEMRIEKSFQVYAHKIWTKAGIRCLIWTVLTILGKIIGRR